MSSQIYIQASLIRQQLKMSISRQQPKAKTKTDFNLDQVSEREFAEISLIGNYKYYSFYGCMLSEPQKYVGTHVLFFLGLLFYFIFTAKYQHPAIITITIILYILIVVDMGFLAFTDPGIIPKIVPNYETEEFKLEGMPIHPHYLKASQRDNKQSSFTFVRKGHFLRMKFCSQCCIYQPPRTRHCYDCDVCVQKFDHHCPWVGTCIAKNNYKFYYLFLILSSILTLMIFGQSIQGIVSAKQNAQVAYVVFNSLLTVYTFLGACFVWTLLILHTYFIKNGLTTLEYCKDTWDVFSGNPYRKKKTYKHFFKMFDYPPIVVSDPEARFKDRQKMEKIMQESGVSSLKRQNEQKSFSTAIKSIQEGNSEKVSASTKLQKEGITEQDIKVTMEENNEQK